MIKDLRIQEFSSTVAEKQPQKEQLELAQQEYFLELALELFNFESIQQRLQYAAYMVYTHLQKLYPELNTQYANTRDAFRSVITEVGRTFPAAVDPHDHRQSELPGRRSDTGTCPKRCYLFYRAYR